MSRKFRKYPSNISAAIQPSGIESHATSYGYSSSNGAYITINDLRYKYGVLDTFDNFTIFINDSIGDVGTFKLSDIPEEYSDLPVRNITSRNNNVLFVIDNPDRYRS